MFGLDASVDEFAHVVPDEESFGGVGFAVVEQGALGGGFLAASGGGRVVGGRSGGFGEVAALGVVEDEGFFCLVGFLYFVGESGKESMGYGLRGCEFRIVHFV